ncbi:MAG: glycosyltransferase [Selenomonadaceae bacterium]|nr:glycosyltransferase [Selenomonadaceae bacterium]
MNNRIAIIIAISNVNNKYHITKILKNILVPSPYSVEVIFINEINVAKAYNTGLNKTTADYKLYIREDVFFLETEFLSRLTYMIPTYEHRFAIGCLGSYLTSDGNYAKKNKLYGSYKYRSNDKIEYSNARNVLYRQKVHILDSSILFTNSNIKWDECVGNIFYMAAYCCKLRNEDVSQYVIEDIYRLEPLMGRHSDFDYDYNNDEYTKALKVFTQKYKNIIRPLVSIGIPTFNNHKYFEETLLTALNQDYDNIEIIVGDDSTNNLTELLIKDYLEKYDNINYINNGGPLGNNGEKNITNILNLCRGNYLQLLFHDDLIYHDKISTMMELFLEDVDGEIGFIASSRDLINSAGEICINQSSNSIYEYNIINGRSFGKKFFQCYFNYIGENSTVLLRKENVYRTQYNIYDIGYYWNIRENCLGDITTWLDISRYKNFIYINRPLSAFRLTTSNEQNSNNVNIQVEIKITYLLVTVMAWLNNDFIDDELEFYSACDKWAVWIYPGTRLLSQNKLLSEKSKLTVEIINTCYSFIHEKKYQNVLDLLIRYLLIDNSDCRELIKNSYYDEKDGLWKKIGEIRYE